MTNHKSTNSLLASLAYLIVIITGLKAGSSLIVPLLMAFFWFLLFLPLVSKLRLWGVADFFSTIVVFGFTLIILLVVGSFLVNSGQDLVANLPLYQEKFDQLMPKVINFFENFGFSVDKNSIVNLLNPSKIINYTTLFLKEMGGVMTNGFLTLLVVMFLFLESSLLSKKIFYLTKTEESQKKIQLFVDNVNIYFLTKTATSISTGVLVFLLLLFFELDYALLFGLLAFFLNYIPSIGSLIASLPALFIALVQLTPLETSFIALGYIIINNLIGNFIEPKILGRGLGLSTLIVFLSMVFWGWVLGPIGMFLSVPLTVVIKIACDNNPDWHWVSVLLSDFVEEKKDKGY